jgi:hypothetical protein
MVIHLDKFDGTQQIPLPILPLGTQFSFYGSSKPNGPIDMFSGNPTNGDLTNDESFFPLFDQNGA